MADDDRYIVDFELAALWLDLEIAHADGTAVILEQTCEICLGMRSHANSSR
jgi:hypothetical protein